MTHGWDFFLLIWKSLTGDEHVRARLRNIEIMVLLFFKNSAGKRSKVLSKFNSGVDVIFDVGWKWPCKDAPIP